MTVDRRRFLQVLGAGAAVLGTSGAAGGGPRWERLRARMSGPVLLPGDAGYE
ncbi:twin-arginine translocation signal domain-containing protein [Kutzneria albida]|nr:twin-arginine translocation signal domain-containing protein [Kutzneria albida]AHH93565.1 putative secreted protein [Kutzneria albida DSM 43870]